MHCHVVRDPFSNLYLLFVYDFSISSASLGCLLKVIFVSPDMFVLHPACLHESTDQRVGGACLNTEMAKWRNTEMTKCENKIKSTSSKIISLSEAVRWKTQGAECHTWPPWFATVKRCNPTHKLCWVSSATKSPPRTSKIPCWNHHEP